MITLSGPVRSALLALDTTGWVALYTLAVGSVIGAVTWGALHAMRDRSATTRYGLAFGALACVIVVPLLAAMALQRGYGHHGQMADDIAASLMEEAAPRPDGSLPGGWHPSALADAVEAAHAKVQVLPLDRSQGLWLGNAMGLLGLAWLLGAGLGIGRLACDWRAVNRLLRRPSQAADHRWVHIMGEVAARLGVGRPVEIRVSDEVDGPVLVGWWRPVVFLPPATHRLLSDHDAQAILAHELAHVRSSDFAANILQSMMEAILIFHPVVRWLGTRIRHEREYRADALALRGTRGSARAYAGALAALEESRSRRPSLGAGAVAAHGGELLRRIQRLSAAGARAGNRRLAPWEVALIAAAVLATTATLMAVPRHGVTAAHAIMSYELGLPRDYLGIARERGLISP